MKRWKPILAGLAVVLALGLWWVGRPTLEDRLDKLAPELSQALASRKMHIDPGELLDLIYNANFGLRILDLRSEPEFNLFHLQDAARVTLEQLRDPDWIKSLPSRTVLVLVGNGEALPEKAYRLLAAWKVPNLYILEGGLNHWIEVFAPDRKAPAPDGCQGAGCRRYRFEAALGERHPESDPGLEHAPQRKYQKKVKPLGRTVRKAGGCG